MSFFNQYWRNIPPVSIAARVGSFLSGFVIYEGFQKILAPVPLAKVWANSLRVPNPRWPLSTILKIIFAMVWPTILHSVRFLGLIGVKEFIFDIVLTYF